MIAGNFRPGSEFGTVSHRFVPGDGARVLVGPGAVLLGWIPIFQHSEQLPEAAVLRSRWEADPAIGQLLQSGNMTPPDRYSGPVDLCRHLNTHDFRGALAIDQPTLFLDEAGRPVLVECLALARVGSTAMRGRLVDAALDKWLLYSAGIGESCGDISLYDNRAVTIRVFLRLKLGRLGQVAARAMTGLWPPWATMSLEYTFDLQSDGVTVDFLGSTIPSQSRYIGWERESAYELDKDLSEAGLDGFLRAGGCRDAQPRVHHQVRRFAKAQDVNGR